VQSVGINSGPVLCLLASVLLCVSPVFADESDEASADSSVTSGPSNVEQIERAKKLVASVGRRIINGPEAIEYLDIPFPATRPKD